MSIEPVSSPLGGPAHIVKLGELIGPPFVSINSSPPPALEDIEPEDSEDSEPDREQS